MKKLMLWCLAPLVLIGCMSTADLQKAFDELNHVRDEQLESADEELKNGGITPEEWVDRRDEIFEQDRLAREALAKERGDMAGREIGDWLELILYAALGVSGLGGGVLVTRRGVKAMKAKRAA